jgi:hypothetical protein
MDQQTFDDQDAAILRDRIAQWQRVDGPRVGDYVRMLDGTLRRFTHDWGDALQVTVGPVSVCAGDERFYFAGDCMSFSGSLDPAIPAAELEDTGRLSSGAAWFFHHDQVRAHYGVRCTVPCRVYRQRGATP